MIIQKKIKNINRCSEYRFPSLGQIGKLFTQIWIIEMTTTYGKKNAP